MNGGAITTPKGEFNLHSAAGRLYKWFRESNGIEVSTKQLDHISDELGFAAAVQRVMEIREQLDPRVEWICRRSARVDGRNRHYYRHAMTQGRVPPEPPAMRRAAQVMKGEGKPVRALGLPWPSVPTAPAPKRLEEALPMAGRAAQQHIFDPRPNW